MPTPSFEYASGRVYYDERTAHRIRQGDAQRIVGALIAAAGGQFVQRKPTGIECMTGALDTLSEKPDAWLRSREGSATLARLGLTVELVQAWRGHGGRAL